MRSSKRTESVQAGGKKKRGTAPSKVNVSKQKKKAEAALSQSGDFLNTVFESINDPFNIIGRDYRIMKANESYARMRGKTVEELIGKRCYEILQKREDVCEDCSVKETFESAKPNTKEKLVSFPAVRMYG